MSVFFFASISVKMSGSEHPRKVGVDILAQHLAFTAPLWTLNMVLNLHGVMSLALLPGTGHGTQASWIRCPLPVAWRKGLKGTCPFSSDRRMGGSDHVV